MNQLSSIVNYGICNTVCCWFLSTTRKDRKEKSLTSFNWITKALPNNINIHHFGDISEEQWIDQFSWSLVVVEAIIYLY